MIKINGERLVNDVIHVLWPFRHEERRSLRSVIRPVYWQIHVHWAALNGWQPKYPEAVYYNGSGTSKVVNWRVYHQPKDSLSQAGSVPLQDNGSNGHEAGQVKRPEECAIQVSWLRWDWYFQSKRWWNHWLKRNRICQFGAFESIFWEFWKTFQ